MALNFTKMHGCGNDYIYFNCFEGEPTDPSALSIRLSDRHKGVGGDGIVLICRSSCADAKMRMFNADGSEGKMCGNAIRCVGKYLYDRGMTDKTTLKIETLSGIKTLELQVENGVVARVRVDMGAAVWKPADIPMLWDGERAVGVHGTVGGFDVTFTGVSMGNPHCVIFGDDPDELDLPTIGPKFENDPIFPERVNTEFVQVLDRRTLKMRVWERGSGETFACGTGACAVVSAAVENGFCDRDTDVTVKLRGGDLTIRYTEDTVLMTGEAVIVFDGTVE